MSPADAERFGVVAEAVQPAPFAQVVKTAGEVLPSAEGGVTVTAPAAGVVTLAHGVSQGMQVKAGQALASVSAKNMSGGDANAAARAAYEAALREVERLKPLLADGLVTKKEYNDAVAALEQARALYSPMAATGTATSPRAGVVTSVLVTDGEWVDAGAPIATVASATRLTLRALLPATQASFAPRIADAVISTHGGEPVRLSELGGRLVSASSAAGNATPGYVPVYFTFDNSNPSVVPGTGVEVWLSTSPTEQAMSVPLEAVTEQMGQMFVFVRVDEHGYVKRPVTVGHSDGQRVAILSGIEPGEQVVTRGATFVRLAQQATVVPEGHSHNH